MKKLWLVLVFTAISNLLLADGWSPKSNFPLNRTGAVSFSIGNYGYAGLGSDGVFSSAFFRYNPTNDNWDPMATFPITPVAGAIGFANNTYGFVLSGSTLYRYDPIANTWTLMTAFPGPYRVNGSLFTIGDFAYFGLGSHNDVDFWQYSMQNNTWSSIATFPGTPRQNAVALTIGSFGYVGTGFNSISNSYFNDFYRYDAGSDTWQTMASLPSVGRIGMVAFTPPGSNAGIFALGGRNNGAILYPEVYEFTPPFGFGSGTWATKNNFPFDSRIFAKAMVIQNEAYMGTGSNGTALNTFYKYLPCDLPTQPTITFSGQQICSGQSTTLQITGGDLYDATQWEWYENTCGSTPIGVGTSIVVSPNAPTAYFARGVGGCVINAPCGTTIVPVVPSPITPVIIGSGPALLCNGQPITLSHLPLSTERFADTVFSFSSEFGTGAWSANQILGQPNVYPQYGDYQNAWATATADNQREFIELGFANPAPINGVRIYETFSPGAVDTIYIMNPNTNLWEVVFATTASPAQPNANILEVQFPLTSFPVGKIRIAINSPAVSNFNEIDAVSIGYYLLSSVWNPGGIDANQISVSNSGNYTVTVTNSAGCSATSAPFEVTEDTIAPSLTCANDTTICLPPGQLELCGATFIALPSIAIPKMIDYVDRHITYTNVSINGGSNSAIVAPGSNVNLSFNMSVAFDYQTGYCPGCVVQSYIGIGGSNITVQCFGNIYGGFASSANVTFTAPIAPGLYYLTQDGTLDYFCQPRNYVNTIAQAIAVIRVGFGDVLQVTDNCGDAEITNDAPNCLQLGTTAITWTATDLSGNTSSCIQNVTLIAAPQVTVTPDTVLCSGNSVQLTANGANFYSWSSASNLYFATTAAVTVSPTTSTAYTVTTTDLNGCSNDAVVNVFVPNFLLDDANICIGDSVVLNEFGESASTTFLWSTGATTASITVAPTSNTSYTVTVTESGSSCGGLVDSATVFVSSGLSIGSVSVTDNTCFNGTDGIISFNDFVGNGGGGAFASTFGPGYFVVSAGYYTFNDYDGYIDDLFAGTYQIVYHDDGGCSFDTTITITEPPQLTLTPNAPTVYVCPGALASVQLTVNNGVAPFVFSGADTFNLQPGYYEFIVTDNSGCSGGYDMAYAYVDVIEVGFNVLPQITVTGSLDICDGDSVLLEVTPATFDSYLWSNGTTTYNNYAKTAGANIVTVTNIIGCTETASANVVVNNCIIPYYPPPYAIMTR